jgi:hypothetical protein
MSVVLHAPAPVGWLSLEVRAMELFQVMLQAELAKMPNAKELVTSDDITVIVGMAGEL